MAQVRAANLPVEFDIQYHPYILKSLVENTSKVQYLERGLGSEDSSRLLQESLMALGRERQINLYVTDLICCSCYVSIRVVAHKSSCNLCRDLSPVSVVY